MTGSRYHSQQSEILINVSENHSSANSSPHAMPREQTQVEKSPTIRASESQSGQAIVPEAIERIANSQQESVPTQALSQPIHQDDADSDDEELYAVSPRAKAKLDAVVLARKSSQAGKVPIATRFMLTPTTDRHKKPVLPARNPIDALLSEGAVMASSAANARADDNEQVIEDSVAEPPSDYATLDTKLKAIDAKHASATKVTSKRQFHEANAQRRKPNCDDPEDDEVLLERVKSQAAPQRPDPSTSAKESSKTLPATQVNAKSGTKRAVAESTMKKRDSGEMVARKSAPSNSGNDDHITASGLKDATADGKATAVSSSAREKRQKKPVAAAARGRPQRQAKESALEKLKAKNGTTAGSSESETSVDSEDDPSDNFTQPKAFKDASKRSGNTNQLPTPVTLGSMAKQSESKSTQGKLKSVKPKPTATTTRSKAPTMNLIPPNAPTQKHKTRPAPTGHEEDHVSDESKSKPHRLASYHPSQDPPWADSNEQPAPANEPQPQRPGALKRPARSFSGEKKPQNDSTYELEDEAPRTKKRGRRVSKAFKASTVKASTAKVSTTKVSTTKAGPTRQKMQSESVKERLEPVINSSRHPSVSVQTQDKAPNRISQRQDVSSAERRERHGHSTGKDASRQHKEVPRASKHLDNQSSDKAQASAAAMRQQLGSSQANAIFIEQDDASTSSPPPSPPKITNAQTHTAAHTGPRQNVTRPQTPTAMPSSPPAYGRGSTHKLAKDKPTIIAFSKQGPRNQGFGSARKTPGSGFSSRTTFFDMVGEEDSSSVRGLATKRADAPAAPKARNPATIATSAGNVSRDGEDVFDDFIKNGKNTALANMLKQPQSEANRLDQPSEDDGFVAINDFDGTTLVGDDAPPDAAAKEPTASQIAMPPPKAAIRTAATQTTKPMLPKPSKSKSVVANAGTRVANDTPRPIQTKPAASIAKLPEIQEVVNVKQVAGKLRRSSNPQPVPSQRGSQKLPAGDLLPTKAKSSEVTTTGQPKRKRESNEQQVAKSPKKAKIVQLKSPQGVAQPNPTRSRKSSSVPEASTQHGDPVKRTDRRSRASRRSTQGSQSQGVDITGSPYPVHLDVPTQATALETFSQQSGLSPDQMSRSDAEVARKLDLTAVPRLQAIIKPGSVSSNGKPVPAAPNERSRAVTRVASGPLAQQLLDARHEQSASSDPFTSSRGREATESTAVADIGHKQAVRDHNVTMARRVSGAKRKHQEYKKVNDDDDADPDKTLVEPIADPDNEWQQITNSPAAKSTSSVSTPNAAFKALEDVGDWRNTLKPHQTHLFDALVIAAHKLVRHMVDHETASQDAVADYRRRGEIIVTELQRAHAREYQRYSQEMLEWKKRAADELAESGRKLKQSMRDAERARSERRKAGEKRDGFNDMLEEMVAELE